MCPVPGFRIYYTTRSGRHIGYHRPPQVDQVEVEMIEFSTVQISFVLAALAVMWLRS